MKTFASLVHEHFKFPEEKVTDDITSKDVPEWDSMNYLLFIADLEKEYRAGIPPIRATGLAMQALLPDSV